MKQRKLYGYYFKTGDVIIYHDHTNNSKEAYGIYISHKSTSKWINGMECRDYAQIITIINKNGEQDIVGWIKPVSTKETT
jgi:hypothetical protein